METPHWEGDKDCHSGGAAPAETFNYFMVQCISYDNIRIKNKVRMNERSARKQAY